MTDTELDMIAQLLGIIWAVGALCSWLGLILIRGTGNNAVVRFLSFLPVVGLVIILLGFGYSTFTGVDPTEVPITPVGLIVELVGAVLVGIFTVAAGVLRGWRRFAALFIVLAVVLGGLLSGVTNIETAAYRIIQEALANVEKHAAANTCCLRLRLAQDGETASIQASASVPVLTIEVSDDGRGSPAERGRGLGLLSMQARAAEVGGWCRIEAGSQGGTCVRVHLPCHIREREG